MAPPKYSSFFISLNTSIGSFPDLPKVSQKIYWTMRRAKIDYIIIQPFRKVDSSQKIEPTFRMIRRWKPNENQHFSKVIVARSLSLPQVPPRPRCGTREPPIPVVEYPPSRKRFSVVSKGFLLIFGRQNSKICRLRRALFQMSKFNKNCIEFFRCQNSIKFLLNFSDPELLNSILFLLKKKRLIGIAVTFWVFGAVYSYFQALAACSWNARFRGLSLYIFCTWGSPSLSPDDGNIL